MPATKYIKLLIDSQEADLQSTSEENISINYQLEDPDNFQVKTSADATGITLPANKQNDKIFNTWRNAGVQDMTANMDFHVYRKFVLEAAGNVIMMGRMLLTNAIHNRLPVSYGINLYGDNFDWIIDLKDSTLYDFLKGINFDYTTANIVASWDFDGSNLNIPFVFAPVRYMLPFDNVAFDATDTIDQRKNHYNTDPSYLCPSLSIFYILYNAFKSIGYKIVSSFFETDYFRRMVMPWTFGPFPSSNGTKQDVHKFVAASFYSASSSQGSTGVQYYSFNNMAANSDTRYIDFVDLKVVADGTVPGTYDNHFTATGIPAYTYNATSHNEMTWKYNEDEDFGIQIVNLSANLYCDLAVTDNSDARVQVWWYKNGDFNNPIQKDNIGNASASYVSIGGATRDSGTVEVFCSIVVQPGDTVSARVYVNSYTSKHGYTHIDIGMTAFQFNYFKTPLDQNGKINFQDYTFFKSYKFTDFLKGVIDTFNLSIKADPKNKTITIEPTHDYSLVQDQSQKSKGYFNGDFLDWSQKQDLSKNSTLNLYSDGNREYIFKFKDDASDGCWKVVSDRVQSNYQYKQDIITTSRNVWAVTKSMLGAGKYVLPDRFAKDITQIENSFFSPCMHYLETQWKEITGVAPQLICIIPENISNTSASEASNTFQPKIAWYKGVVAGVGGWRFNGVDYTNIPFMFGVNYQAGGENDPILSYSDEKIGANVGIGLLRRFYLQRMAIIREGKYYDTNFMLNNYDVSNVQHREHIGISGQRWELVQISNYKPMSSDSTQCSLRMWVPITEKDSAAIYPTENSVNGTPNTSNVFETKYQQLMCLASDIPQQDALAVYTAQT